MQRFFSFWAEAAQGVSDALGETVKPATLKRCLDGCEALDVWQRSSRRWLVVPRRPPAVEPETVAHDLEAPACEQ